MEPKRILLVNLFSKRVYKSIGGGVTPLVPPLGLICIASSLFDAGYKVNIFDFMLYTKEKFIEKIKVFKPQIIGMSFTTPLINEVAEISEIVKNINKNILIVGGGPHCSSFPESSLKETSIDIAVIGEGDFTILELASGKDFSNIKGIAYRKNNKIFVNERKDFIKDLDSLPFPVYHLFEFDKYCVSSMIAKKNPAAWLETSRGCVYNCIYCNKTVFGKTFRVKSPERIVEEFIRLKKYGFKEVFIADDGFTTDIDRAKKICQLLIENKVNLAWSTLNGIRADRVDIELLKKMKDAGCYRIYFGIESGSQHVLNKIRKGITLEQIRHAVKLAKKVRLEVVGYFMLGLPEETEKTMQETIDFAKSLNLDLAKVAITIPLPATDLFNELEQKGLIKSHDWEKFKFHSVPSMIYEHQNVSWETVEKYYRKFYKVIYSRPQVIFRIIMRSLKNKTLIKDIAQLFYIIKSARI